MVGSSVAGIVVASVVTVAVGLVVVIVGAAVLLESGK